MGIAFRQVLTKSFGVVAFAIILFGAVGIENRLEVERENFFLVRMN